MYQQTSVFLKFSAKYAFLVKMFQTKVVRRKISYKMVYLMLGLRFGIRLHETKEVGLHASKHWFYMPVNIGFLEIVGKIRISGENVSNKSYSA